MIIMGTDFDDTLYFHDGRGLRDKDAKAIEQFQQDGNLFGLCTGRSPGMMAAIDEKTQGKVRFDFTVFSNGACIVFHDQILFEAGLEPAFIEEMISTCPDAPIIIHHSSGLYTTKPMKLEAESRVLKDFSQLHEGVCYGLSLDFENAAARECIEKYKDTDQAVCAFNSRFCDFIPVDASKGKGLLIMADRMNIPYENTAAIGDSYNDLPMLQDAAHSFTFQSSPAEVRNCADELVDGVWEAISILEPDPGKKA